MSVIETLKKIDYQNLNQFQEDLNKNFAIIQNSPLFKGIPGEEGVGIQGLRGIRGIKFLFVNLQKFQSIFVGELSNSTQIDINYINTKLLTFENKQKLMLALDVTEFVDKDVIVLTNTIILSYDYDIDSFINTGISFNEQANLVNNIQQQIENYVQYYIGINQTINNLSNVFEGFVTLAKNYSDTNNVYVTSNLTNSSVFSPFIPGFNSNIGVTMNNHKYFGFSDAQFPVSNNGTIVMGSIKKYYNLLMNTISTDDTQTLTSDYAPGVGNIPAMVVLQDTEKSGILFGYKSRQNLKRFANLYKNELNEVVLKSDSGINPSEYSELIVHREYMKFAKLVQFGNDLEVSRDTSIFGDINNRYLRTGKFTKNASLSNDFNKGLLEVGREKQIGETFTTKTLHVADNEMYKNYISRVLVTDNTGLLSKNYALETATLPNNGLIDLVLLPETINSPNNVLTSNYFAYLCRKINVMNTFINGNYWKKNQYYTGEISDLWLSSRLNVDGDVNLTGMIKTDKLLDTLTLGGKTQKITSKKIIYDNFKSNVLVTDNDGALSNQYKIEDHILDLAELEFGVPLDVWSESNNNFITTKFYAHLAKKINGVAVGLAENYWTKEEFESGVIPSLKLNTSLFVKGNVTFASNTSKLLFYIKPDTGQLIIGNAIFGNTRINSYYLYLQQFAGNMIYVNTDGSVSHDYTLELNNFNEPEVVGNTPISDIVANPTNKSIARGYHVRWLGRKINNLMAWITTNVWYKNQFPTGEIPSLVVSQNLQSNGKFHVGNSLNPAFKYDGINETKVGTLTGNIEIRGENIKLLNKNNIVPVTDNNGVILDTYSLETVYPYSGPGTGGIADSEIFADYWIKDQQPQPFNGVPNSPNKIVRSFYIGWLVSHIKAIRTLIFDRPTYAEMGSAVPNGIIVYWNNAFGPIPTGWIICDGRWIPGVAQRTPNLVDKYVKGSAIPNIVSGNVNNELVLSVNNLPAHNHYINGHSHGYKDKYYNERGTGGNQGFAGSGDTDSDNSNPANNDFILNKTTDLSGAGYTNNTGTGTAVNIDPHHVTLIPIMKYWDGIGTVPVTVLPSWATITNISITPNLLKLTLNVTQVDTTVNACEILGSKDNGLTWSILKVYSNVAIPLNIPIVLPSNGDWKFKMIAKSGDSFGTTGEFSNIYDIAVYLPWAQLNTSAEFNDLNIKLSWIFNDNTVTNISLLRSTDNNIFTVVKTQEIISGQNYIFDDVPISGTYYYKIKANNGNPIITPTLVDDTTNTCSFEIDDVLIPSYFCYISNVTRYLDDLFEATHGVQRTQFAIYLDFFDANVISVRLESYNYQTNTWITFMPSIGVSSPTTITFIKNGNFEAQPVMKFRLKALSGNPIFPISNEYESYN